MLEENLQLGMAGDSVKILQEKLKILGYYNAVITGDFGPSTEIGVKAFQQEYGLEETGIVNQEMWEMLLNFSTPVLYTNTPYPTLSIGSSGNYVQILQTKLKALLYYTGAIDSIFGTETQIAVKRFQLHNNLTTTGIVNDQTWSLLDTLYGKLNACVTGNSGNEQPNYTSYTVSSGDTLYSIARRFNTTVDSIKSLNNLSSDILRVGQVLKIPANSNNTQPDYITYTVVRGDTLYGIASKFNTTVDAIKSLNNLSSNILSIGQVLKIPTNNNTQPNYTTYTVVRGDTLYGIASKFNTTVDAIKSLNNLSSNILSIGQVLKIPSNNNTQPNYTTYTVVRGDTLYGIASKFNTTVDVIKSLNNLSSDILSIGQVLKIYV